MQYSQDKIIPQVEEIELPLPELNDIALSSWRRSLDRFMPEIKRQLFEQCSKRCDNKVCESLCRSGESVAWGLSQIRFNVLSRWN